MQSSRTTPDKWLLQVRASVFDAYLAYWMRCPGDRRFTAYLATSFWTGCSGTGRILPELEDAAPLLDSIASELTQQGLRAYVIPLGGSNGLGAAAYAAAFLELLDQFEGLQETLDAIIVPTVSGGTLAGLLLGAAFSGWKSHIGISAGDDDGRFDG